MKKLLWGIARAGWLLSYGLLAIALHRAWPWAVLAGLLGIFALLASYGRWGWPASMSFLMMLALAGGAAMLRSWEALLGVLCGLVAWDVELFARRLEPFETLSRAIVSVHLKRLGLIVLISGLLGAVALNMELSLSFGWALFVAVSFLIGFLLLLRQAL